MLGFLNKILKAFPSKLCHIENSACYK
uniref:Uncharacterized protein n=1 Tax=Rhizophora mucronata TaxID=61149 RepID=A0A2P2Q823_RHIMU